MQNSEQKYRLIETSWGMLAYIGCRGKLIRLITPGSDLLHGENLSRICHGTYDKELFPELADKLIAYFNRCQVDFDDIPCELTYLSPFSQCVLNATRKIPFAETVSYKKVAEMIASPRASRAVGRALALNPIPIVIPCHRVIRSDGQLGGYSGSNDINFKFRLIKLEQSALSL